MKECQSKCQITCESLEAEMKKIRQETEQIQAKIEKLTESKNGDNSKIDSNNQKIAENQEIRKLFNNWLPVLTAKKTELANVIQIEKVKQAEVFWIYLEILFRK